MTRIVRRGGSSPADFAQVTAQLTSVAPPAAGVQPSSVLAHVVHCTAAGSLK